MTGGISTIRLNCTLDHKKEEDSACSLSSTGDKPPDSYATNSYSLSSNNIFTREVLHDQSIFLIQI